MSTYPDLEDFGFFENTDLTPRSVRHVNARVPDTDEYEIPLSLRGVNFDEKRRELKEMLRGLKDPVSQKEAILRFACLQQIQNSAELYLFLTSDRPEDKDFAKKVTRLVLEIRDLHGEDTKIEESMLKEIAELIWSNHFDEVSHDEIVEEGCVFHAPKRGDYESVQDIITTSRHFFVVSDDVMLKNGRSAEESLVGLVEVCHYKTELIRRLEHAKRTIKKLLEEETEKTMHMQLMIIKKGFRSMGIGTLLHNFTKKEALKQGDDFLILEVLQVPENKRSKFLHEEKLKLPRIGYTTEVDDENPDKNRSFILYLDGLTKNSRRKIKAALKASDRF